jgi:parvulin-like peptidyl-prolyl isomerase
MKRCFLAILISTLFSIVLSVLLSCGKMPKDKDHVVARINDFKISYGDLADQFKRTRGDVTIEKADQATKRTVLNGMINEQLTLLEAYRLGYNKDEKIMAVAKEKERELAAKALRKREIDNQVISEEVLQRFYQWSDRQLDLRYIKLYAGSTPEGQNKALEKANEIYAKALSGEASFQSLAANFSEHGNAKQDSGKMGTLDCFNTLEPFFEHAYPLSAGGVTKAFLVDRSVYLLKVEKIHPVDRDSYPKERPEILERVREIYGGKLSERTIDFNKDILAEYHYALFPEVIAFFSRRISGMKTLADSARLFSAEESNKVLCKTDIEETTIGALFSKTAPYYWNSLDQKRVVEMLLSDLNTNRLAKHKAMQLRLNESPEVKQEHESWFIYYLKKVTTQKEAIDKIDTSDRILRPIYEQTRNTLVLRKQATVHEIFCKSEPEIERAYQLAKIGSDFAALHKKYSQNMEDRTNGIVGPFAEGANGKLGEQAFSGMKVGEISKPFKYHGGFSIIRLLSIAPEREKTYEEAKEELKSKYITGHWEQSVAEWLDRAAKNYKIHVSL